MSTNATTTKETVLEALLYRFAEVIEPRNRMLGVVRASEVDADRELLALARRVLGSCGDHMGEPVDSGVAEIVNLIAAHGREGDPQQ